MGSALVTAMNMDIDTTPLTARAPTRRSTHAHGVSSAIRSHSRSINRGSMVFIVAALVVMIRTLPVDRAIDYLNSQGVGPGIRALLGVGLLATFAFAAYVVRLARSVLRERSLIIMARSDAGRLSGNTLPRTVAWPWGTMTLAAAAFATLIAAACVHQQRASLQYIFGPGSVSLGEAYEKHVGGPEFDHAAFDALLHKHVDKDGWVDYAGLQGDAASLDAYITALGNAPFAKLDRDEKLAFLINAYNAFTLRLILDHYPVRSIKDIPAAKRWDAKRWRLSSMTLSLNQIEHEQIRPKFAEPRIHFALVCAAIGCPKLRNEAYQADRIDAQLEDQTRYVHAQDRWFRYSPGAKEVHLTKLYDWYGSDFKQIAGSVLNFAARYSSPLKTALDNDKKPRIRWLEYDWTLNDRKHPRAGPRASKG